LISSKPPTNNRLYPAPAVTVAARYIGRSCRPTARVSRTIPNTEATEPMISAIREESILARIPTGTSTIANRDRTAPFTKALDEPMRSCSTCPPSDSTRHAEGIGRQNRGRGRCKASTQLCRYERHLYSPLPVLTSVSIMGQKRGGHQQREEQPAEQRKAKAGRPWPVLRQGAAHEQACCEPGRLRGQR
jgi:hypothetical protein